jgi:hypothetical protein
LGSAIEVCGAAAIAPVGAVSAGAVAWTGAGVAAEGWSSASLGSGNVIHAANPATTSNGSTSLAPKPTNDFSSIRIAVPLTGGEAIEFAAPRVKKAAPGVVPYGLGDDCRCTGAPLPTQSLTYKIVSFRDDNIATGVRAGCRFGA